MFSTITIKCLKTIIRNNFFFFICVFHLYGNLPYTYPPSFSPFLRRPFLIPCPFLLYRQS